MRYGDTFTVECEVNVFDVLSELDDEELLKELDARRIEHASTPTALQAYEALRRGDMATVERFVLDAAGRVAL